MTRKQQNRAMLPPAFHPPMAEAWVEGQNFLPFGGATGWEHRDDLRTFQNIFFL
jgi:hypothetical protein